ncbi:metallophosphoesterase [Cytophaga aurantiaca]|uniref:metallophosphoesterase n=1 Tax=Cytophaga aurantiaca TaxID=29530 RepID=UPI000366AA7D|nr:metallophosphoesterase [Cytophaga aurantiaca]
MRGNLNLVLILLGVFLLIDWYVFSGVKALTELLQPSTRKIIHLVYWGFTAWSILTLFLMFSGAYTILPAWLRTATLVVTFILFLTKIFFTLFLLIDDFQRLIQWVYSLFQNNSAAQAAGKTISRSDFLLKVGLAVSAIPLAGMAYGIFFGAHDYTVRRRKVVLKNLPKAWNGLKIVQLSDIHSGSFYNKAAVERGVALAMKQKPDIIFFTGDLVNNVATEMDDYIDVFAKLKAPLGVYSTLGNHDYGDYASWETPEAKRANLNKLIGIHKQMGWDILMNEHRILKKDGAEIAILGIENWGAKGNFPKYGKMQEAYPGTEQVPVKLLLSHDPSHWDAEVLKKYKDIDVMFAGHTHGMQFGIEKGGLKWSPVQWMYEQWAGLYEKQGQYLYVNRGFGYIGFPGRVGMAPEITVMELVS